MNTQFEAALVPATIGFAFPFRPLNSRSATSEALPSSMDVSKWMETDYPPVEQILESAIDMGAKVILVAPSKARKSFFMMQAALAISVGQFKFLSWKIPRARRVLLLNLEISEEHYQRRLKAMMKAMGITKEMLGDRLRIVNARGYKPNPATMQEIADECRRNRIDLILIDPIYKLMTGDESKQQEVKALLNGLDSVCVATGAALWYAHHAGKGEAGDRLAVDRASGSGVWARDFDCQFSITPHIEENLMVVEQISRGYPPREAETIRWQETGFFEPSYEAPIVRTSANRRKGGYAGNRLTTEGVLALWNPLSEEEQAIKTNGGNVRIPFGPMHSKEIYSSLVTRGATYREAEALFTELRDSGLIVSYRPKRQYAGIFWGPEKAIAAMIKEEAV